MSNIFSSEEDYKEYAKVDSIEDSLEGAFTGDLMEGADLDLDSGSGEDAKIDYSSISSGSGFNYVSIESPIRAMDAETVAEKVEAYLVGLVEDRKLAHLSSLFGGGDGHDSDSLINFKKDYHLASQYNPVLRWYGRFAKAFGKDFSVENDALTINDASDDDLLSSIMGINSYGDAGLDSPIVSLVEGIRARLKGNKRDSVMSHFHGDMVSLSRWKC